MLQVGSKGAPDQYPLDSHGPKTVSAHFLHYYMGVMVWIGCFGNLCCLFLFSFRRPVLARLCTVQCLRAAVGADLVFLSCLGIVWLKEAGVDWTSPLGMCGGVIYFANTATFSSAWMVTMIASQAANSVAKRDQEDLLFITTDHPRWSTLRKITMLIFTGCLLNTWTLPGAVSGAALRHYELTMSETRSKSLSPGNAMANSTVTSTMVSPSKGLPSCHVDLLEMNMLHGLFAVFDTLTNYLLPISSATILTIWAACMLKRVTAKENRLIMIFNSPARIGLRYLDGVNALSNARDNKDAFAFSLAKCLTYLTATVPMLLYRLWILVYGKSRQGADIGFIHAGVYSLFYTQFSCNIFIYCVHALWRVAKKEESLRIV